MVYGALTTADITLSLSYTVEDMQHVRLLEVIKRRGRAQLLGQHPYILTSHGVEVFPRLETYALPELRQHTSARAQFGLAELDALIGGGLTARTVTLLAGAPGTGKTILALTWATATAHPNATSTFFSFRERSEQLTEKAATFGVDIHAAVTSGSLILHYVDPGLFLPDAMGQKIIDLCHMDTTQRMILDDIGPLLRALGRRATPFLAALAAQLYAADITTLWTYEINPLNGLQLNLTDTPLGFVGDNLLVIQQHEIQGELRRLLAVLRMRFSAYDRTIRELRLEPGDIRVLTPSESSTSVLAEGAAASGRVAPS